MVSNKCNALRAVPECRQRIFFAPPRDSPANPFYAGLRVIVPKKCVIVVENQLSAADPAVSTTALYPAADKIHRQMNMFQFNENIPAADGAYIVGGSVRDMLLDRIPVDYDIAVRENPEKFARKIAANTGGRIVIIGKARQTIVRVVSADHVFDVTPIHGVSIEADLLQRDFTVNAVAYSLSSNNIIDVTGGIADIKNHKIRMVSPKAFEKDPIRLFRAFRMGACLNFAIEPATMSAIRSNAALIQNAAGERIREELIRLLQTANSFYFLKQMVKTGLLFALLPEIKALQGCFQNRYHRHDAFHHTLSAYERLESVINGSDPFLSRFDGRNLAGLNGRYLPLLKWAMLLHDLGKPATRAIDKSGTVHFYGHARKSARMAAEICRRLRFSNHEVYFVDFIVRTHLRPLSLFTLRRPESSRLKPATRFFMKCGKFTPFLLLHALADHKGKNDTESVALFQSFIAGLLDDYFGSYRIICQEPPLISGHDLINDFGLTPSPLFKKILGRVEEARRSKTIQSRNEAYRMVEKLLST